VRQKSLGERANHDTAIGFGDGGRERIDAEKEASSTRRYDQEIFKALLRKGNQRGILAALPPFRYIVTRHMFSPAAGQLTDQLRKDQAHGREPLSDAVHLMDDLGTGRSACDGDRQRWRRHELFLYHDALEAAQRADA
jgi:hypothetical protein